MRTYSLPPPSPPPSARFVDVSECRRSVRYARPTRLAQVLDVLRFATAPRGTWAYHGIVRYEAPVISSGALHGIDLLILHNSTARVLLYNRTMNQLNGLRVTNGKCLADLRRRVRDFTPDFQGTIVGLVADNAKYHAAYDEPESLVWRDSGALLQMIAMTAFAFGLESCPLGLHGGEFVSALDVNAEQLTPCGIVQIGQHVPGPA